MVQLIAFVCGAVLMSLELLGSRILAPTFGSSIFVWGSLISVFLGALSVGYYFGGTLADRKPSLGTLAAVVAAPGIWVLTLPLWAQAANEALYSMDLGPRYGPLAASVALFLMPSVFLGMVSPFTIRLGVTQLHNVGNRAGRLYAISTAGSIFGTLLTSFFLIPSAGTRFVVHSLGLVLLILALAALLYAARRSGRAVSRQTGLAAVIFVILAGMIGVGAVNSLTTRETYVYSVDSLYHNIRVQDQDRYRYLRFDQSWQSGMDLDDPEELLFTYTRYFYLAPLFAADTPRRMLFIGLGGGSIPKHFHQFYPKAAIDVVEIDPEVVKVARDFFAFREDDRLQVVVEDGRNYLRKLAPGTSYDLVLVDAYYADSIPFHLTTREFLQLLSSRLSDDGVVVSNIIGSLSGARSKLFRSMLKTFQSVFSQVYVFPVNGTGQADDTLERNIIVVATKGGTRLRKDTVIRIAEDLTRDGRLPSSTDSLARTMVEERIRVDDVRILTDDRAPVDYLLHL